MVKMPYYLFHRGRKNESQFDRNMFFIVVSIKPNTVITNDVIILDVELDVELDEE